MTELNHDKLNLDSSPNTLLADLLKENTNLLELALSRNWISGVGAKELAEGLEVNTVLKKLTLIAKDFNDLSRV
ncbi:hypothetical protein MP638_003666, partial [Amoeboaphelidium occidentale]